MNSWEWRQRAQTFGNLAQVTRSIGGIAGLVNDAVKVSQVNEQLAYLEQSYQDYNESLQKKMFDTYGEFDITGPSGGQAPSVVKKSFGQAGIADIERDEEKFFHDQLDYITKNTTNRDARREMIQHLQMKHIQNKGVVASQWETAADHEAKASLNTLISTVLVSNDPWETKVSKITNRVNQMRAAGRLWPEEAEAIITKATNAAQYSFAYNGAMAMMKETGDPAAAEAWLEKNTPFFDGSPEKRTEISDEVWRSWGILEQRKAKILKQAIEDTELIFMDRLQKGDIPTWEQIRDSILPRDRKEHYQGIINRIAETAKETEAKRLEAERKLREARQKSDAYLKAYSEIIDWPMNQEEKIEDRILGDELLSNDEKEHLIDEYRQRNKEAQDAAKKKDPLEVTDESVMASLIKMFYNSDISNEDVKKYIEAKHGYGLSNTDARTWEDKLKTRQPYQVYKLSTDMISQFFDDSLKEETDQTKILEARKDEALILKLVADEAAKGELTEEGLLTYTRNLIDPVKRKRIGGIFSRFETEEEFRTRTEPEVKEAPAAEVYSKEMQDRFTAWKGTAPASTGENEAGEIVFSDGTWWYVYRRRAWYRWDGTRWRISTK